MRRGDLLVGVLAAGADDDFAGVDVIDGGSTVGGGEASLLELSEVSPAPLAVEALNPESVVDWSVSDTEVEWPELVNEASSGLSLAAGWLPGSDLEGPPAKADPAAKGMGDCNSVLPFLSVKKL